MAEKPRSVKSIFQQLEESMSVVRDKKVVLDDLSQQVQAASAAYQSALKDAETIHRQFAEEVGAVLPSARVR